MAGFSPSLDQPVHHLYNCVHNFLNPKVCSTNISSLTVAKCDFTPQNHVENFNFSVELLVGSSH